MVFSFFLALFIRETLFFQKERKDIYATTQDRDLMTKDTNTVLTSHALAGEC